MAVRRRDEIEKLSVIKFRPSIRKSIAPKKKEAPTKSIWGREEGLESSSKIIIRAIRPIPIGKLIKKMYRQEYWLTIQPPKFGPTIPHCMLIVSLQVGQLILIIGWLAFSSWYLSLRSSGFREKYFPIHSVPDGSKRSSLPAHFDLPGWCWWLRGWQRWYLHES